MYSYAFQRIARSFATHFLKQAILICCLVLSAPDGWCQKQAPASAPPVDDAAPKTFTGKVVETINAATYTYVLVDTGKQKLWAATAPQFAVKAGDSVTIGDGMPMRNYHSQTLKRDFDVVYFTGSVKLNGASPAADGKSMELPKGHPPIAGSAAQPTVDLSGIKKASGGKTIAEIFAGKAELKGKPVKVRGKVVKYNPEVMGKNWLHIQDGTGSAGSNDLTVTTSTKTKVGDTILVSGTVVTDKDFGAGYQYNLIIEDAKVTVE